MRGSSAAKLRRGRKRARHGSSNIYTVTTNSAPVTSLPSERRRTTLRELPLLLALVALAGYFALRVPGFSNAVNLGSIGRDVAIIGTMGIGMTLVVITGGIDLSCASILALSASCMAVLMERTGTIALPVVVALAVAVALGGGNAFLITVLNAPPIVATLATLSLYRVQAIQTVTLISDLPSGFRVLGSGWGSFSVFLAGLAAGMIGLRHTAFGRHVFAVGGNTQAARLAGLRVKRVIGWTYVISALTAGVAGLIASAMLNSVQGNMMMGYELDVIAAVVIGGTSITGGRGSALGTAAGAGIMAVLRNGLIVAGLDVYWYQAIIGLAILVVGGADRLAARRAEGA